jgi:hypothetical protein
MNFHPSGEADVREPGGPVLDAVEAAVEPVLLRRADLGPARLRRGSPKSHARARIPLLQG